MIVSKRIYYSLHNSGLGNYIILDYDPYLEEFCVRKGCSYKESGSVEVEGDEDEYQVSEFIEEFPKYECKVIQGIKEFREEFEE